MEVSSSCAIPYLPLDWFNHAQEIKWFFSGMELWLKINCFTLLNISKNYDWKVQCPHWGSSPTPIAFWEGEPSLRPDECHISGWKLLFKCNQSSVPVKNYLLLQETTEWETHTKPCTRLDYLPPRASLITSSSDHPKKTKSRVSVHSSRKG